MILDGNPSGAILTAVKYDRDYDWSQSDGVDDGLKDSSHFQKINSLEVSRKGTLNYHDYCCFILFIVIFYYFLISLEGFTVTTLLIINHVACRDTYPKNYWKRCRLSCEKIKARYGCRKKWDRVLKGKCKLSLPKWHRDRYVNQYCKQTCMKCGRRVE